MKVPASQSIRTSKLHIDHKCDSFSQYSMEISAFRIYHSIPVSDSTFFIASLIANPFCYYSPFLAESGIRYSISMDSLNLRELFAPFLVAELPNLDTTLQLF